MTKRMQVAVKAAACLAVLAAAWTFSLPLYVDVIIAAIIVGLCAVLPARDFGLLALSIAAGTVLLGALAMLATGTGLATTFYREHEKYVRPGQVYQANVDDVIRQPHGDLAALDPLAPREIREPRTVHFRTDSLGYRNASDYHGQRNVLVGDSFAVGNGTDWPDTLPALLARKHGIDAYSIAFPSAPLDYERRAAWFLSAIDPEASFSFLMFEGNDFNTAPQAPLSVGSRIRLPPGAAGVLDGYDQARNELLRPLAPWLPYQPVIFAASRRLERAAFEREGSRVWTHDIGGHPVGFFERYDHATLDPHPTLTIDLNSEVIRRIACVLFVPTKLRVYAGELPEAVRRRIAEPAPAYKLLVRTYAPLGVKVIDLTPPLRAAAQAGLREGKPAYVFWRDDTHWNGHGMRAAAAAVAACMRAGHTDQPAQPDYSLDGKRLSRAGEPLAVGDFAAGNIDVARTDNQSYLIEGWATSNDGQHAAKRVLAFVGTRLVSTVPTRIARPDVERARGTGGRSAGFQLAIPRNLVENGAQPIRIFALADGDRATELALPRRIAAVLRR